MSVQWPNTMFSGEASIVRGVHTALAISKSVRLRQHSWHSSISLKFLSMCLMLCFIAEVLCPLKKMKDTGFEVDSVFSPYRSQVFIPCKLKVVKVYAKWNHIPFTSGLPQLTKLLRQIPYGILGFDFLTLRLHFVSCDLFFNQKKE